MSPNKGREEIEALKAMVDIRDVISRYIKLNGHNMGCCPFHADHTPSFSVNVKGQYFHCFGCGVGGDVIKFLQLFHKTSFGHAISMLREFIQ